MAAELEEKLTCSICLVLYHDPVTLSCGHNFCKCCIQDWWRGQEKQCPECREPFPEGAELRRNVTLSGVLELVRAAPSQAPGPLSASESGARCPRHGWPLELFCRTEGRGVCSACTVNECRNHERALPDTERREREVGGPGAGRGRAGRRGFPAAGGPRSSHTPPGCAPRCGFLEALVEGPANSQIRDPTNNEKICLSLSTPLFF